MSYHAVTFAIMIGVGLLTALVYYLDSRHVPEQQHQYGRSEPRSEVPYNPSANRPVLQGRRQRPNPSGDKLCCICLENIREYNRRELCCGHLFHNTCIGRWVQEKNSCPECRSSI